MNQNNIAEEFKTILDYPNYEVSNFGNIKNIKTGRILKSGIDGNGYYIVKLYKNKIAKTQYLHRLVMMTFLNNPENKKCVDHIDRNKLNNNILNLRWASYSENGMNKSKHKNNSSTQTGVHFHKKTQKWLVHICINGKLKHCGLYTSFDEAVLIRKEKEEEYYGEFQVLDV